MMLYEHQHSEIWLLWLLCYQNSPDVPDDFTAVTIGGAVQRAKGLVGKIHHSPGVVFILKKKTDLIISCHIFSNIFAHQHKLGQRIRRVKSPRRRARPQSQRPYRKERVCNKNNGATLLSFVVIYGSLCLCSASCVVESLTGQSIH